MSYTTVQILAAHAGRHVQSVRRALRLAGIIPESFPGVAGKRLPVLKANRFLARQWPGTPPIQEESK